MMQIWVENFDWLTYHGTCFASNFLLLWILSWDIEYLWQGEIKINLVFKILKQKKWFEPQYKQAILPWLKNFM